MQAFRAMVVVKFVISSAVLALVAIAARGADPRSELALSMVFRDGAREVSVAKALEVFKADPLSVANKAKKSTCGCDGDGICDCKGVCTCSTSKGKTLAGAGVNESCGCTGPSDCTCKEGTCFCPRCIVGLEWAWHDSNQIDLFDGNVQVGAYLVDSKCYRDRRKDGTWGPAYAKPRKDLPVVLPGRPDQVRAYAAPQYQEAPVRYAAPQACSS